MLRDRDLARPPTSGNTRTLVLPSGGTLEIPMPASKSNKIVVKPPKGLGEAIHESRTPLFVGVLVGVALGGALVWYVLRKA